MAGNLYITTCYRPWFEVGLLDGLEHRTRRHVGGTAMTLRHERDSN